MSNDKASKIREAIADLEKVIEEFPTEPGEDRLQELLNPFTTTKTIVSGETIENKQLDPEQQAEMDRFFEVPEDIEEIEKLLAEEIDQTGSEIDDEISEEQLKADLRLIQEKSIESELQKQRTQKLEKSSDVTELQEPNLEIDDQLEPLEAKTEQKLEKLEPKTKEKLTQKPEKLKQEQKEIKLAVDLEKHPQKEVKEKKKVEEEDQISVKRSEVFASNYLIFHHPTEMITMLVPLAAGLIFTLFNNKVNREIGDLNRAQINELQFSLIDNYLLVSKYTTIILLTFFVCWRWSNMITNQSYGFWLSLGGKRSFFFRNVITKFLLLLMLSQLLGFGLIVILYGLSIEFATFINMIVLLTINYVIILSTAILIGNSIPDAELAALSFFIVNGIDVAFNTNSESFLYMLFHGETFYRMDDSLLAIILSSVLASIMVFVTRRLHLRMDLNF